MQNQLKTGLMYSPEFGRYIAGRGYLVFPAGSVPFMAEDDYYDTPERVLEAHALLEKTGLLGGLEPIAPRLAEERELLGFHSPEYLEKLKALSAAEGGIVGPMAQIGRGAYDVIRLAAGGDLNALDAVMTGRVKNAFCLQRPPAAHAERSSGFGFCIVNNFNLIANRAREVYGLKRILIVDFDNHYKKGIEDAWYGTDEVLYAETHQTGALAENSEADRSAEMIGEGRGRGFNIPIPMPAGSGDDAHVKAFKEIIEPVADQYRPELVILVAGFASNVFDPLCRQQITANGFGRLAAIAQGIADRHAGGRMIAVLEGGKGNYMSYCILRVIEAMSGLSAGVKDPVEELLVGNRVTHDQAEAIARVKAILSPHWKL